MTLGHTSTIRTTVLVIICLLTDALLCAQERSSPFQLQGESCTAPFELNSNKIYVQVKVNGRGPWPFVMDTGAYHSIIDLELARELELDITGREGMRGAGEKQIEAGEVVVKELSLPGLTYRAGKIPTIPINRVVSPVEGRPLRGLLGAEVFNHFVVDIDYARRQVTFHDSRQFRYAGQGTSLPLTRMGEHAFVSAEVETLGGQRLKGKFLVDTGARVALTLNTPFVNEHGLIAAEPRPPRATVGGGIGGELIHYLGRVKELRVGSLTIPRPVTTYSQDRTSVFASAEYQGLIGADILRRYRVIVDYPHQRIVFEESVKTAEPYEFDMSGMFLIATTPGYQSFVVQSVVEGSPAAAAGVKKGDRIEAVDGNPAAELTLEELRQQLKRPGAEVRLQLRRGEDVIQASVTLRRQV
jgi:hypothetical protein